MAYNMTLRSYMSDEADFFNVIDLYEKRDLEKPFYLFNVTMQNHGGYSMYQNEVDVTVIPTDEELQQVQLMEYLSLARATDDDLSELEKQYMVPFVIWANYDIEEEEGVVTSPNYLRAILKETAGMPLGSYDKFLLECREEYPAINFMAYMDADGKFHELGDVSEEDGILWEYQMLQYANVFDKSKSEN